MTLYIGDADCGRRRSASSVTNKTETGSWLTTKKLFHFIVLLIRRKHDTENRKPNWRVTTALVKHIRVLQRD